MGSAPVPAGDDRRLDILMLDYAEAREDERSHYNVQAAVTGVAVALLAVIATLVSDTCQLNKKDCSAEPPDIFLAAAPAIPLGVLALLQLVGASAAVRTYYMRALEQEIRQYASAPLTQLAPVAAIGPASYTGLLVELTTLRRGRGGYRILAVLAMLIAFFTFGGLTVYIAFSLPAPYRVGMLIGYGTAFTILLLSVSAVTLRARTTFLRVARRFGVRQHRSLFHGAPTAGGGRSLASYLLFPRPEDWIKWLFIPLVFVLVSWGRGQGYDWTAMAGHLLVAEYLVYAARYQWNDVRGLRDDLTHPQAGNRLRLPRIVSPEHARLVVGSSLLVAVLRLAAACALGVLLGQAVPTLALAGAVFAVALGYEYLRSAEQRHDAAARALWVVVGAGYALRYLVGLHAAGASLHGLPAAAGAVYAYAFGIMFVLMTWVLEGTAFCRPRTPQEWFVADDALRRKRHVMLLLAHLRSPRVDFAPVPAPPAGASPCADAAVLADPRGVRSLLAPWRSAFLAAALSSVPLGLLLAQREAGTAWAAAGVLLAGAAGLVVVRGSLPAALAATATLGCLLAAAPHPAGFHKPAADLVLPALPWLLGAVTYLSFSRQSYNRLKNAVKDAWAGVKGVFLRVVRWVVGEDTWRAIT